MQIVIDIPKSLYANLQKIQNGSIAAKRILECVRNGTPLPKGHGRLKDIDKIISDGRSKGFCEWYDEMKYAETIIEADIPTMYYPQVEGITPTVISSNGSDMLSAEEIDNLLQALAKGESEE